MEPTSIIGCTNTGHMSTGEEPRVNLTEIPQQELTIGHAITGIVPRDLIPLKKDACNVIWARKYYKYRKLFEPDVIDE